MADEQPQDDQQLNQPKEIRGKLLTPDELTDWGNQGRFVEPGIKTESGASVERESDNTLEEEDDKTPDTIEESLATPKAPEPEVQEPAITAEDPGEFVPQDYSFEVTVYDDEGKNGKPVTIRSVEQWDELLEKDPNFGSAAALAKGLRLANKMEGNLERDKATHEQKKASYDEQVKSEETRVAATNNMVNEINYLIESKDLPTVDPKYQNADWSDPEVAKQPGVKEQVALLTFMRDENNRRHRLGLPAMTSVLDAFNAYERANAKTSQISQKKLEGEQRKAAGAVVAPASPSAQANAPKGIKVGRAGNLRDLGMTGW